MAFEPDNIPLKIELPHESFWSKFLQVHICHDGYLMNFLQLKGYIRKKVANFIGVCGVKTENIIMSIIIWERERETETEREEEIEGVRLGINFKRV